MSSRIQSTNRISQFTDFDEMNRAMSEIENSYS